MNSFETILSNQPTYAANFQCIGPACEDHCCGDWDIPIDQATYNKYKQFPLNNLGSTVAEFVILDHPHQPQELYAQIHRTPSGLCPFFAADHLCGIQKQYGPHLLSSTCSIYPRSLSLVAGTLEGSLSLSCPEAVRNVLLAPEFIQHPGNLLSGNFRTDNFYRPAGSDHSTLASSQKVFLATRGMLIDVVRDRSRPLWLRLLMIGYLCDKLDEIERAEGSLTNLNELFQQLQSDPVQSQLVNLPSDPRSRLETIFALTDLLMQHGASTRFQDVFWSFIEGIASPAGSLLKDDLAQFLYAERNYCRPFLEISPFIPENYLVNYMFQHLFPYGREGSANFVSKNSFAEYLQMATLFAWINGLLIGVAALYMEAFSAEHVVKVVQSFTRAVEHYPGILEAMDECIRHRGLNSVQGMAVLLKP